MNQNINHNKQGKFILTRWEGLRLSVWLGKSSSVKDGCFNIPGSRSMLESLSWSETLLSSESAVTKRNVNFVLPSAKKKKNWTHWLFFFFKSIMTADQTHMSNQTHQGKQILSHKPEYILRPRLRKSCTEQILSQKESKTPGYWIFKSKYQYFYSKGLAIHTTSLLIWYLLLIQLSK